MRPQFHFTVPDGWINDPHGITFRSGGYDVFYQYVPGSTAWAPNCHWGHARGKDLLSLEIAQVALAPGEGDDGIWTGCLVTHHGDARIFYTATSTPDFGIGRVRVATPVDHAWNSWTKGDIVVEAPAELDLIAFRDPFIRSEGEGWRMFVGAAGRDGTAMALTYASSDLVDWNYEGVALQRSTHAVEPVWMGALWECPQVFESAGHAIMLTSVWDADVLHYAAYALGSYDGGRFAAREWAQLTWGSSLYAPSLFFDADGQPALTFWLRGIEGDGWAGAHSVPYRLDASSGRLIAAPHPDVEAHRVPPATDRVVDGLAADVEWACEEGSLEIRSGGEAAATLARRNGSLAVTVAARTDHVPVRGALRIIVDGPVLELSSRAGVYAVAIAPAGPRLEFESTVGPLAVYGLE
jgi:beta-fructofuranosidase